MVTINIQKKDLFLISAIAVFLIGAGIVIATGSSPVINGHDASEVKGTVTGACQYTCTMDTGTIESCGNVVNAQCNIQPSDAGQCLNPSHCVCNQGSPVLISFSYDYTGLSTADTFTTSGGPRKVGRAVSYLCITQ
jgi:hypothetical protein